MMRGTKTTFGKLKIGDWFRATDTDEKAKSKNITCVKTKWMNDMKDRSGRRWAATNAVSISGEYRYSKNNEVVFYVGRSKS